MNRLSVLCLVLGLSVATMANAETRAERLNTLMEAEGVSQALDAARDMVRQQTKADADRGMAALLTQVDTTPELIAQLRAAYTDFIDEVMTAAISREDFAAAWAEAYGSAFSDEEITQLLAFYRSPLGQKTVSAARSAMPQVMQKLQADIQPRVLPAVQRYTGRVQKIIADCHCQKTAAAEAPANP